MEIEDFRAHTPDENIAGRANDIFQKYFTANSPYELNVDSTIKSKITKNVATPSRDLFDAAQEAVWKLMVLDLVPKFINSSEYAEYTGTIIPFYADSLAGGKVKPKVSKPGSDPNRGRVSTRGLLIRYIEDRPSAPEKGEESPKENSPIGKRGSDM